MCSFFLLIALSGQPLLEGDPIHKAWSLLEEGVSNKSADQRAHAVRALGLLVYDRKAEIMAEKALTDPSIDVRVEAAAALGQMKDRAGIPHLKEALKDKELKVVLAAANALYAFKDPAAYQVYFALLTGERKSGEGLVQSQLDVLRDRKQIEKLAFETGIGFVPFGGMGWEAWKTITQDDSSPVKAAAAEKLATDPDPKSARALIGATFDKKWRIRVAASNAIAKRGDRKLAKNLIPLLVDENDTVRYEAAAGFLHLSRLPRSTRKQVQ